jgi:hypothetical protein
MKKYEGFGSTADFTVAQSGDWAGTITGPEDWMQKFGPKALLRLQRTIKNQEYRVSRWFDCNGAEMSLWQNFANCLQKMYEVSLIPPDDLEALQAYMEKAATWG